MNYDDKMTKLKGLVEDYNSQAAGDNKVDFETVTASLKKSGVFNDATLSSLTEIDLTEAGMPKILARQAVIIVAAKEVTEGKPYIGEKKAAQMSIQQLVESHDPRDSDNAIGKRLTTLSKDQPCIVYSDEVAATIAVAETVTNISNIRDNFPAREFITYKGQPTRCFKIGVRPFDVVDENPLFVGQPLLPQDQICTVTNRSWAKASLKVKQLLRLACQTGELRNTLENVHDLLDTLEETSDLDKLFDKWCQRYPRAALKFKELEQQGTLPTLKIQRGSTGAVQKTQDPFAPGHRRT